MSEMEKQPIEELTKKQASGINPTDTLLVVENRSGQVSEGAYQVEVNEFKEYVAGDAKRFLPPTHGTAGQFLRSTGDGGSEWGDAASPEEIAEAVTDWLEENVPTGETLVVDESLTIEGAAADAKVTGEKITAAEEGITDLRKEMFSAPIEYSEITTDSSWTIGSGVASQTGDNFADNDYCRTGFVPIKSVTYIHLDSETYDFNVWEYTSNSTGSAIFAPKGSYNSNDTFVTFDQNATYFRIGARRKDLAHIQSSDITALTSAIKTYATTDPTLSIAGAAADAKAVGDNISILNLGNNYLYPVYDLFERITSNQQGDWIESTNRISCRTILHTDNQIFLTADTGYDWAFNTFDSQGVYITTSGWKTGTFAIPANTYFCVLIRKSDNTIILPNESIHLYMSIIQNGIRELKQTALAYGTSGTMSEPSFEKNGTTLIVTLPTRMFVLGYDFSIYTKDFSETQTISVAHNYVLYYDFADKTLKTIIYSSLNKIYDDVFVLMYNNNGRPIGELARYYKRTTTDTLKPIISTSILADTNGENAIGVSNAATESETITVIIPRRCFVIGYKNTIDSIDKTNITRFDIPHNSVLYIDFADDSYNVKTYAQYSAVINDKVLLLYNNHGRAIGQWAKYQERICSSDNFKTTIFCSRQGDIDGCPENSLVGLKRAKTFGYNRVRVSVSFTSDNVPVCFHDEYLGERDIVYDGSGVVVTDRSNPITSYTYEQLQNYDFGLYKGETYRNTKIASLSDVITLMRNLGCGLDIEMKFGWTAERTEFVYNMIALAGMIPHTMFIGDNGNFANLETIISINEYATVSFGTTVSEARIDKAATLQTGKNDVWIALLDTDYSNLTDALRLRAINKGLKFKYCSVYNLYSIPADVLRCEMVEVAYMKYPAFYVMKGN